MFIKKNTSRQTDKTYTYYLLVQAVPTPKGPRQKVICSLGDLSPRPKEEWLKLARKVEVALSGQQPLFDVPDPLVREIVDKARRASGGSSAARPADDDIVAVHTDRVETEDVLDAGGAHVGVQFFKRLGMDEILATAGLSERSVALACAMVMNRLISPASENAMPDWIRRNALSDILGTDFGDLSEESLYRNMDRLYPHRAIIESELASREKNLFNLDTTIFFYDLTSTYFEGQAQGIEKAKRGYSRDKRPDCKQVVIGLAINRDGFPAAHEIFDGNVQDRQTLGRMLDVIDKRVGLREGQTVVVDRGMAYGDNIKEIKGRKLHYIVASRQSERDEWLAQFEDLEGFSEIKRATSPLNPYQKKSKVLVRKAASGGETLVLCHSDERLEKDRAIREKHEERLLSDIAALQKRIAGGGLKDPLKISEAIGRLKERYPRVARYYHLQYDPRTATLRAEMNTEKKTIAAALDGCYILKTDRQDLDAEEAWRIYTTLTRAESAFRAMKSPLAERPIFHQIERRVETHIFLCLLAYHILVSIEKTLLDQGVHTSWATTRETLDAHKIATIVLPTDGNATLKIRKSSTPNEEVSRLYTLLNVPSQIIPPRKTWHSHPASMENVVTKKIKKRP